MMYKTFFTVVFTLCISLASAQTNYLTRGKAQQIDQLMEEEMLFQEIMGMSIGIVKDGEIVYTKGYGFTDIERTKPVQTSTVFNWASISKVITAVAAFQLIEDQKLSKESKPKTILDGIWTNNEDDNEITLGQLLSHRSGMRHYNNDLGEDTPANYKAYSDTSSDWNAKQSVAVFNEIELKSTPGTEFRYSTFGYNLAGAMVEKQSSKGYVAHVNNRIIGPMEAESIVISREKWKAFSKDCTGSVGSWIEDDKRMVLPGGGWKSDIQDLTKFMSALINNELLENTFELWEDVINGGKPIVSDGYRFGLRKERDSANNEDIVMHGGKHENVRTIMAFFPDSKLGFTVMINGGYANADRVFRKLATAFDKPQTFYSGPLMTREFLNNCSSDITAFWTPGEESSIVRFGYNEARFNAELKYLESKKYHLIDCEYYLDGNELLMSGIFQKGGNATKYIPPSRKETFERIVGKLEASRYIVRDIEVFERNNTLLWSGIATKQLTKSFYISDLSIDDFQTAVEHQRSAGRTLIDMESYIENGLRKWAGLFRNGPTFEVSLFKTKDEFATARRELLNNGMSLKDLEIANLNGTLYYSGVFQTDTNGIDYRSKRTHYQIAGLYNSRLPMTLKLVDIERPYERQNLSIDIGKN